MKDEEMAEEIANKRCHEIMCYGHCSFNSPKHHRCGEWHREYNCALEGIKAGRPQWHDLEKEPTDLPKDNHNVWCKALDHYGEGWYDKDTNTWTLIYRGYHLHCIEAWCEIPTFDKE